MKSPSTNLTGCTTSSILEAIDLTPDTNGSDHTADADPDRLEPIAVIGFDLVFPQDASSTEAFWKLLLESRSAMTDVPPERFNLDGFHAPRANRTGMLNARGAHYLKEDIAKFDAPFFSVTPAEAACMDPQQRMLLEAAYKALENAGLTLEQVQGTLTSVHVGCFIHDYETMLNRDPEFPVTYKSTGTGAAMLANRISWFFNFSGPSITLDTACSSSLVALHLACQDIRSGHSKMGLVSGCNVMFDPDTSAGLEALNFLSPDSKCYSFDHRANGYSRGEGVGTVVIKALSSALQDGDTIRAVIRNTGCNQDGRTPGITQPSSYAQETLIKKTYSDAGLTLAKTRYFESHGTGTVLGDALEAKAVHSVFRNVRSEGEPIYIGAVKSNIGHLEGASGMAGLIKAILVLEKGIIPPNIWYEQPNPRIQTNSWSIGFPLNSMNWPETGLRRASVSSFGFGGSNAHVVLDDAYNYLHLRGLEGRHRTAFSNVVGYCNKHESSYVTRALKEPYPPSYSDPKQQRLLVWSSTEESGVQRLEAAYQEYFNGKGNSACMEDSQLLEDLAYTLAKKRSQFPWRSHAITASMTDLRSGFKLSSPIRSTKTPRVCFIFTGQGAQWYAMGRGLLHYQAYQMSLKNADEYLRSLGCDWSLLDELNSRDESSTRLSDPLFSQPICTALQVALVDLLLTWGIKPMTVVGHSSGEIAAAYSAGGISRESALKIAYFRGKVSASAAWEAREEPQGMMAVGLSETDVAPILSEHAIDSDIGVAAANSPKMVTLSGSLKGLEILRTMLEKDVGVFCRYLKTNVAYHTKHMESAAFLYRRLVFDIEPGSALSTTTSPTMVSTVTGDMIPLAKLRDVSYWVENMVSQVRFVHAISRICAPPTAKSAVCRSDSTLVHPTDYFLELGPHSSLQGPIRETLETCAGTNEIAYGSVLVRFKDSATTALEAAAHLFRLGYPVDVAAVNNPSQRPNHCQMLIDLPCYPFNHTKRYWLESRVSKNYRFRQFPHHELLGTRVADWNPLEAIWSNRLVLAEKSFIKEHKVNGLELYPAAGMLAMAIEAARQTCDVPSAISGYRFRDVVFRKALVVPANPEGIEARFYLRPVKELAAKIQIWNEFRLCVYENGEWSENCRGAIAVDLQNNSPIVTESEHEEERHITEECESGMKRCTTAMKKSDLYKSFSKLGLLYGPAFQPTRCIRFNDNGESAGIVDPNHWQAILPSPIQSHVIHPATLDAIFQLTYPAITHGGELSVPTMVPTALRNLWVSHHQIDHGQIEIHTKGGLTGSRNANASILGISLDSREPHIVGDLEMTFVSRASPTAACDLIKVPLYYNLEWKADVDLLDNGALGSFLAPVVNPTPLRELMADEKEELCYWYIYQSLQAVSTCSAPADSHLHKYWGWMKQQLFINNSTFVDEPPVVLEKLSSLREKVKRSGIEGRLLLRVADNLIGVLEGRVDPLQMLFADDVLEEYYRLSQDAPLILGRAMKYIDTMAHKDPSLKILEIGAGTGSLTGYVTDALRHQEEGKLSFPRFSEYMFTDISPSFFGNAKDRFNTESMNFKVLDIETDPEEQGFEIGHYDLILAANVLHATTNLKETLQNTRKLLKPGGKLILYEATSPRLMRAGFVFGLLPGWWRSKESSRKWSPLLRKPEWHNLLLETNFSGLDTALSNYESEEHGLCSALISTALPEKECVQLVSITLIIDTSSTTHERLTDMFRAQLRSHGYENINVVSLKDVEAFDLRQAECVLFLDLESPALSSVSQCNLEWLQHILGTSKRLIWVIRRDVASKIPQCTSMTTGLARVIRTEREGAQIVTLDLEDLQDQSEIVQCTIKVLLKIGVTPPSGYETEYMYREGHLCVGRVLGATDLTDFSASSLDPQALSTQKIGKLADQQSLQLAIGSIGLLDTVRFANHYLIRDPLAGDEIQVQVKSVGLNFRDLLIALGQLHSDSFGNECAGVVSGLGEDIHGRFAIGDRVVCSSNAAFTTTVRCAASNALKLPDSMSFDKAAALPVVFCTAYYALHYWAHLKEGESVLVHSGAGGFGQAVIQLARLENAELYVTVGNKAKKDLLIRLYGIREDHIFSSRNTSFARTIKRMTSGRGVDVVINSLSGEGLRSSWECVAPFGRFVEVGKKDISSQSVSSMGGLPMLPFSKNIMFASVDLAMIMKDDKRLMGELLRKVFELAEDRKIHTPEPLHVFKASEVEKAFRFMQTGEHMGKIIIGFDGNDEVSVATHSNAPIFDPNATYVITGGLGGIGQYIARWMVDHNAKNLILLSRSRSYPDKVQRFLDVLRGRGAQIATPPCDIADKKALNDALLQCYKFMPPVKGCILAAMVLKNVAFHEMTLEDWHAATVPKVKGTWNLHELLPKKLDFFIMLSSYAGIVGGPGQSNYAAGSTYQDAFARWRVSTGEKAVSIDLGVVEDVGFVAEDTKLASLLKSMGHLSITGPEILVLLEYYCDRARPVLSPLQSQLLTCLQLPSTLRAHKVTDFPFLAQPMFRSLHQIGIFEEAPSSALRDFSARNLKADFSKAESLSEIGDMVCDLFREKLSGMLVIEKGDIDPRKPLHTYGVDSLGAMEIRNWLSVTMTADLAVFEILGNGSMGELSKEVASRSGMVPKSLKADDGHVKQNVEG